MKILVPLDGSELSLHALRHVLRLVREGLQAELVLANVQQPASLYEMVVVHDPDALDGIRAKAGMDALQDAQDLCGQADVPFEIEVVSGDPAHMVVDIAERFGCEAIVMGARGLGGVRGALLGSVSQGVLDGCRLPVTIVHEPEAEEAMPTDEPA